MDKCLAITPRTYTKPSQLARNQLHFDVAISGRTSAKLLPVGVDDPDDVFFLLVVSLSCLWLAAKEPDASGA
jgi:hypothetical protein